MDAAGRARQLDVAETEADDLEVDDLRIEQELEDIPERAPTTINHIAIDLTSGDEISLANRPQSRAEAIVELIIKSDRVFLDGACWRCTEHMPVPDSELGLCVRCVEELRDPQ